MNLASQTPRLRPNLVNSILSALLAFAALMGGMFIASHHPLVPVLAVAGCGVAAALCLWLPNAWLVLLPALLPVIDLAPWTGWLTFEEFDILVLGAAAGAWLRRAWLPGPEQGSRTSLTQLALTGLFLLTLAMALFRGLQDAGGFQFGWFQGYEGSMNCLRLAKSFILAALNGFLALTMPFALLLCRQDAGVPKKAVCGLTLIARRKERRATPQRPTPTIPVTSVSMTQPPPIVSAGGTAATRRGRRPKRIWLRLGLLIVSLSAISGLGLWTAYYHVGHTPGELMDYTERRLQGHPRVQAVALPVIAGLRNWLDEPSLEDKRKRRFIVPSPPPLILVTPGGQALSPNAEEATGQILRVGPTELIRSIAEAARMARDGDTVEIQAGEYHADVAIWHQKKLAIRGVGGTARLFADGKSAEDKAIWVIRNGEFDIANIDFIGARVADRNGAGIRFENGRLRIRNCLFWGNDNGILSTGGKDQRDASIEIENSEFAYNGAGDGYSHNIYIGAMGSLKVRGSYFHHANTGHLMKSRAAHNEIVYNRLTDEGGGRASYELDFPNGGVAHVIGNIIQQGRETENSTLISYGAEQYIWPNNGLFLASNTLINDHPYGGAFLRVEPGALRVVSANNLLIGKGRYHVPSNLDSINDIHAGWEIFSHPSRHDYRLNDAGRKLAYQSMRPDSIGGEDLNPQYEYTHPRQATALLGNPAYPGALQTIDH